MKKNKRLEDIYRSCTYIEQFHLNFNGINGHQIDCEKKGCAEFCCLSIGPGITLDSDTIKSVEDIKKLRKKIITKNRKNKSIVDGGCEKCPFYSETSNQGDGLIHFININMYPAPCQSRCIYCEVHKMNFMSMDEGLYAGGYKNMFNVLKVLQDSNLVAKDAMWQVASGEITIHPYKHRIYDFIRDRTAKILTNCFIYDKEIAKMLASNLLVSINLSIDAGTTQTWNKVKGCNNFEKVIKNLKKYSKVCINPEQITLKYIILPGINDNQDDYLGVIEIMRFLKINKIILSRDNRLRYEKMIISYNSQSNKKESHEEYGTIDRITDEFKNVLKKNGMQGVDGDFWPPKK